MALFLSETINSNIRSKTFDPQDGHLTAVPAAVTLPTLVECLKLSGNNWIEDARYNFEVFQRKMIQNMVELD
jgi:hypothetical protein